MPKVQPWRIEPESWFPRENPGGGEPGFWGSTIEQGGIVIDYLSHKKQCRGAAVHIPLRVIPARNTVVK